MQTDGHGPWRDDGKLPYGRWRLPCGHGNRERAYASVRLVETFFSWFLSHITDVGNSIVGLKMNSQYRSGILCNVAVEFNGYSRPVSGYFHLR